MVRKGPQKPRPRLTLHQQMVSEAMQQRYAKAVLCFLTFLADSDLPSATIVHLCEAASEWVEFLYADGERKGLASDGLAGLQYYLPRCPAKLKLAWKLVKVWQRVEPPMRVLPMSPLVVLGMAGLAAGLGLSEVAAGLLVCFDGILRSGELYQLRVSDVTFYTGKAALRLGLTKAGKRSGQEEMVVINSYLAVRWLRRACRGKRGSQLVLAQGADFFRKWFKLLLSEFKIHDLIVSTQRRTHLGLPGAPEHGTHAPARTLGVHVLCPNLSSRCSRHDSPSQTGSVANFTGQTSNGVSVNG